MPPTVAASARGVGASRSAIPFRRFRLAGARDYRKPPEACVEVGPDGVSLAADPAREALAVALHEVARKRLPAHV